jgi:hypothetical protein
VTLGRCGFQHARWLPSLRAGRRGGETELRAAIAPLRVDQLKDVVAQHRMDRSQLAMKWQTPEWLIELIVALTIARAHKDEAFAT